MIAQRRVNAAKLLLSRSDTPVSTVAEAVGISDYNYFSKVFRNLTGMTPSAFRKAHRAKTSEKMNKNR
jgi:AraC-like DNA-binding protein